MADDKKEARTAKPESLEAKFKLLALLPYDRRAKRKHSLVFGFILDWYHSKYGDALASVRHVTSTIKERDPSGVGLYAGDVHAALTDLVAWGYLEQEKGIGRRASRYVPVWAKLDSVRENANTTDSEISVRENANTCVRENANATPDSVRDSTNKDPSTVTRPQDGVNGIDGYECAAPTAPPPPPAIAADGAGTAQEGFEALWRAYDHKKQKKEARAAYAKLAPDADLHAAMVASAIEWKASWAAQGKPDAPRYTLTKWIEREDYECEPPTAYKTKERKAKDKPAATQPTQPATVRGKVSGGMRVMEAETMGDPFGDWRLRLKLAGPAGEQEHVLRCLNAGGPAEDLEIFNKLQRAFGGDQKDWPGGRLRLEMDGERIADVIAEKRQDCHVKIAHAELIDNRGGGKSLVVWMKDLDGKPEGRSKIVMQSDDQDEKDEGRKRYDKLLSAIGLDLIHNAHELIGGELMWRGNGAFEHLPYEPAEAAA
jgi:hypothetical protein